MIRLVMANLTSLPVTIKGSPLTCIQPYWLTALSLCDGGHCRPRPVWLEWCSLPTPPAYAVFRRPDVSTKQTVQSWHELTVHSFNETTFTRQAIADRIPDGELVVCQLYGGCLWGMIARSRP